MAELVYALALGASGAILESPSLSACTKCTVKKYKKGEVNMRNFGIGVRCKPEAKKEETDNEKKPYRGRSKGGKKS